MTTLSRLWKTVVSDLGIESQLKGLIKNHTTQKNNTPLERKKGSSALRKVISSKTMSWKVFVYLMFNVLNMKSMKIKLTLTHNDDTVTEHMITVVAKKKIDKGDDKDENKES